MAAASRAISTIMGTDNDVGMGSRGCGYCVLWNFYFFITGFCFCRRATECTLCGNFVFARDSVAHLEKILISKDIQASQGRWAKCPLTKMIFWPHGKIVCIVVIKVSIVFVKLLCIFILYCVVQYLRKGTRYCFLLPASQASLGHSQWSSVAFSLNT